MRSFSLSGVEELFLNHTVFINWKLLHLYVINYVFSSTEVSYAPSGSSVSPSEGSSVSPSEGSSVSPSEGSSISPSEGSSVSPS